MSSARAGYNIIQINKLNKILIVIIPSILIISKNRYCHLSCWCERISQNQQVSQFVIWYLIKIWNSDIKMESFNKEDDLFMSKGRDAPRDFNTIIYTKNRLFSAALHPLLQNGAICFYLFRRIDALLQRFLVLLRSILSEPGDEKTCLRGFWPVKIQSGLLSYRC